MEAGNRALAIMERRLSQAEWLVDDRYSVADMALYAYTHRAELGGFDLTAFPGISAWLKRVAAQKGHVPIEWRPEA
jgi:glutathione S-transferase